MKILRMVLLALIPAIALAQQPAPGSLQGIVVKLGTNDPLRNATVELRTAAGAGAAMATTTDADGTFVFPKIPPGTYRVTSTRAGYVRSEYGQRKPGGPPLTIAVGTGQKIPDIRLEMTPGGVISGRISDGGRPVGIAHVFALKSTYNDGLRTMTPVLSAKTDDLGEYHIFWLPPGEYYIAAIVFDVVVTSAAMVFQNPDGDNGGAFVGRLFPGAGAVLNRAIGMGAGDDQMHVPIYFPSTPEWQRAIRIEVGPGAEIRNVNIDASPIPVWRVRGTTTGSMAINDADGKPVRTMVSMALLNSPFPIMNQPEQLFIEVEPNQPFEFPRVVPGSYALYSAQPGGNGTRINIDVRDRDVVGVSLTLDQRFTFSGRIVFESETTATSLPPVTDLRVRLRADPVLPEVTSTVAPPMPDGSFKIISLGGNNRPIRAGDYRVSVDPILRPPTAPGNTAPAIPQALRNAYVKSIRMGEVDVLNDGLRLQEQPREELVVVIGTNPGAIEGRVVNDRQQHVAAATVVLIPEGGIRFRVDHKFTSTDAAGRFQLQSIPPGDYKLFAWEAVEAQPRAWQDPDFVREYEGRGKPIRIEEGVKHGNFEVTAISPRP